MRVGRRIAVAGKMFERRQAICFSDALHQRRTEFANLLRVCSVRADVDDRIVRIIVDIDDRSKKPVYADRPHFLTDDLALTICRRNIASRRDAHVCRERRPGPKLHPQPAFVIGGKEKRNPRERLQFVRYARNGVRLTAIDGKTTDLVFGNLSLKFAELIARKISKLARHADIDHLPDLLAQGQRPHGLFDPSHLFLVDGLSGRDLSENAA